MSQHERSLTPPRSAGSAASSTVATEGPVEQSIHDLVQQERVHFVACGEKIISYSHQVFDDGCHLLESEADGTALICHRSGARPQMLDVLGPKCANAAGKLDGSEIPLAHELDEILRTESRGSECFRR